MTATLNVTYHGESRNLLRLAYDTSDEEVKRNAAEAMNLRVDVFIHFVIDRFDTPQGGQMVYLRPKVPFGLVSYEN